MHTAPTPPKQLVFRRAEFETYATDRGWAQHKDRDGVAAAALGLHRTSVRSVRLGGEPGKKFMERLITHAAETHGITPGAALDLFFTADRSELSTAA